MVCFLGTLIFRNIQTPAHIYITGKNVNSEISEMKMKNKEVIMFINNNKI